MFRQIQWVYFRIEVRRLDSGEYEKAELKVVANHVENATIEEVKIVSIDEYLVDHPIASLDFIKIDIEGFEYETLLGLEDTLRKYKPKLLIEILDNSENDSVKVHEFLYRLGCVKHFITDKGGLSISSTCLHRKNYLFSAQTLFTIS